MQICCYKEGILSFLIKPAYQDHRFTEKKCFVLQQKRSWNQHQRRTSNPNTGTQNTDESRLGASSLRRYLFFLALRRRCQPVSHEAVAKLPTRYSTITGQVHVFDKLINIFSFICLQCFAEISGGNVPSIVAIENAKGINDILRRQN